MLSQAIEVGGVRPTRRPELELSWSFPNSSIVPDLVISAAFSTLEPVVQGVQRGFGGGLEMAI